jgi:AcrR family transcriptional regulator
MAQVKNKSEKRKEEILEAALKCFNKKGYYRTSIDEIAHKTGLTKGAVYYYFKSKKKLFIELFNFKMNPYFEKFARQGAGGESAAEQIWKTIVQQADRDFDNNLEIHKLALEFLYVSSREKDVRQEASSFYKKKTVFFTNAIAAGVKSGAFKDLNPEMVAWNLNFLSIGFFLLYFATNGDFNPLKQHAINLKIFFEGINRA